MKWRARVGEKYHDIDLQRHADGKVEATVDGRRYELSVSEPQSNVYSLLVDGISHEAFVQMRRGTCRVRVGPAVFEVVPDEPGRAGLDRSGKLGIVSAVMPGRVLRVLVAPGDTVEARQGLIVVEAMKMENEIAAPRAGKIGAVRVAAGATVEVGDPLVIME